jgi:hypothetical protein
MLRDLLNFQRINWWVLIAAVGLNFMVSVMSALVGAYLASSPSTEAFYGQYGQPLMLVAILLFCGLLGFVIARIADDVPIKHAILGSLGAVVPFVSMAILSLNVMLLMLGIVAIAANLNGAVLGLPRRHSFPGGRR